MPLFNPLEPPSADITHEWGKSVQSNPTSTIRTIAAGFGGMLKNLCKTTAGIASAPLAVIKGAIHLGVNITSLPNLALQQIAKMTDRVRAKMIDIGSLEWLKSSGGSSAYAGEHH